LDWSLFFSALLSATLLPGSSEILLVYKLSQGNDPLRLLISATTGNLIGSLITYYMGIGGNQLLHKRWLGINERRLKKAKEWFNKWGVYSLFLAWLPIVGDALCLFAGLMKVSIKQFILFVGIGKLARYSFIIFLTIPLT